MTKNDLPGSVRLWATTLLIAVFIIGAAGGAALSFAVMRPAIPPLPPGPPMMGPIPIHELDLTEDQHRKLDEIFKEHKPKLDAILNETFPKVRAINEEIEKELTEILTDEQKARFAKIRARKPSAGRHGGPPPGLHAGPPPGLPDGPAPGMPDGPAPKAAPSNDNSSSPK